MNATSSISLTEVSKWLSAFCNARLLLVNDLRVGKLQKSDVLSQENWILKKLLGTG
jgi:hypothetical protein